jgi:hypothetical protein
MCPHCTEHVPETFLVCPRFREARTSAHNQVRQAIFSLFPKIIDSNWTVLEETHMGNMVLILRTDPETLVARARNLTGATTFPIRFFDLENEPLLWLNLICFFLFSVQTLLLWPSPSGPCYVSFCPTRCYPMHLIVSLVCPSCSSLGLAECVPLVLLLVWAHGPARGFPQCLTAARANRWSGRHWVVLDPVSLPGFAGPQI